MFPPSQQSTFIKLIHQPLYIFAGNSTFSSSKNDKSFFSFFINYKMKITIHFIIQILIYDIKLFNNI